MKKLIAGLFLSMVMMLPGVVSAGAVDYQGERNSFGRFHGHGTYTTSFGETYEGNWVDGKKSGQGTYVWKNGDKYIGAWEDNKRNGVGKMIYSNGTQYEGEWVANKPQGDGVMHYKNKDVYSGLFKDGQPNGQGKMNYANGDRYSGRWQAGQLSGPGVYFLKSGDKVTANWTAGNIDKKSAKYIFQNGLEYQGELKNMKPNGNGSCLEKGVSSPCQYRDGTLVVVKVEAKPKVVAEKVVPVPVPAPAPVPVKKVLAPVVAVVKPVVPAMPSVYVSEKEEFSLEHTWAEKGRFGQSTEIVCKVVDDDFEDIKRLEISAKSQEMQITIKVDNYKGPGKYPLAFYNARVSYKGVGGYATTDEKPGEIVVTRDNGKLVSATFSFQAYPNGNVSLGKQQSVMNGFITAKPVAE